MTGTRAGLAATDMEAMVPFDALLSEDQGPVPPANHDKHREVGKSHCGE